MDRSNGGVVTSAAARIIVVEDDDRARELIGASLRRAGHDVREVPDGESALALLEDPPDLIVLDVGLPGMNGWDVCREVRSRSDVPILFVTAFNRDEDVIRGLHIGGDDYLSKPFSPTVLVARVDALLRRARTQPADSVVVLDDLTVDLGRGEVLRGDRPISLTPTELRVVTHLARHAGEVISPQALGRAAQGYDLSGAEAASVLKVHVRRIRQKLEDDPDQPRYLISVRRLGYSLTSPKSRR